MRWSPLLLAVFSLGCESPLYDATEPGTKLAEWSYIGEVTEETDAQPQTVTTLSGVKLSVTAKHARSNGKRVPTRIEITLDANPVNAEVTATCRPPLQFDGDPLDLLSTDCMVSELSGTKSVLGSTQSNQDTSSVRVQGNGTVQLN